MSFPPACIMCGLTIRLLYGLAANSTAPVLSVRIEAIRSPKFQPPTSSRPICPAAVTRKREIEKKKMLNQRFFKVYFCIYFLLCLCDCECVYLSTRKVSSFPYWSRRCFGSRETWLRHVIPPLALCDYVFH